jgi:F5/8 type C domain
LPNNFMKTPKTQNCFSGIALLKNVLKATCALLAFSGSIHQAAASQGRSAQWMKDAKYGLFFSYLPGISNITANPNGGWDATVNSFNVTNFANQCQETGAGFVVFPITQTSGYFTTPSARFDLATGSRPGELCSRRDLINEIADALIARGIRMGVYMAATHSLTGNNNFTRADGSRVNVGAGLDLDGASRSTVYNRINAEMFQEWSKRWGSKVSMWWLDGCWVAGYNENPVQGYGTNGRDNLENLIASCRVGNLNALVCANPGIEFTNFAYRTVTGDYKPMTPSEDFTAGEDYYFKRYPNSAYVAAIGGNRDILWNATCYLGADVNGVFGSGWGNGTLAYRNAEIAHYIKNVNLKGGVVTIDMTINAIGNIGNGGQFDQMKYVKSIIRDGVRDGTFTDNLAMFKPVSLNSNYGNYELPGSGFVSYAVNGVNPFTTKLAQAAFEYDWNYFLDFTTPTTFRCVKVEFPTNAFATRYRIEYSNDAYTWNLFAEKTITTGGAYVSTGSTVTANYIRVKAVTPNGPNQAGGQMAIKSLNVFMSWEFNTPNNLEGWARYGTNAGIYNSSIIALDVTGADPFIYNPSTTTSINANRHKYALISMKATRSGAGEFFWGTAAQPTFGGGRLARFNIIGDNVWRVYEVNLGANPEWTGNVNNLRFDLPEGIGGHYEIDYIRLY